MPHLATCPRLSATELDELKTMLLEELARVARAVGSSADSSELHALHEALDRHAHGSYGICEHCAQPIPFARLQAIPTTQRCLTCRR